MKLIVAIVQDQDSDAALRAIIGAGLRVTRVASTGGFFRDGNTTLLCGVDEAQVATVIGLLQQTCQSRTRIQPMESYAARSLPTLGAYVEVPVGGATVFVLDVAHFEQV